MPATISSRVFWKRSKLTTNSEPVSDAHRALAALRCPRSMGSILKLIVIAAGSLFGVLAASMGSAANEVAERLPEIAGAASVTIPGAGGVTLAGYLLKPSRRASDFPGVLILHGSGTNAEDLIDTARSLADRGYVSLALTMRGFRGSTGRGRLRRAAGGRRRAGTQLAREATRRGRQSAGRSRLWSGRTGGNAGGGAHHVAARSRRVFPGERHRRSRARDALSVGARLRESRMPAADAGESFPDRQCRIDQRAGITDSWRSRRPCPGAAERSHASGAGGNVASPQSCTFFRKRGTISPRLNSRRAGHGWWVSSPLIRCCRLPRAQRSSSAA